MTYGPIGDLEIGQQFRSRADMHDRGLHRHTQAGIAGYGNAPGAAESIVLSGGYKDDLISQDSRIIRYTGMGGQDTSGNQIKDQVLDRGNKALTTNLEEGIPIRVFRRIGPKGSPYEYLGLYRVDQFDFKPSEDGPNIFSFHLVKIDLFTTSDLSEGTHSPGRKEHTTQRIIRSTQVAIQVKRLHKYQCQICGTTLETPSGPYAEAAHIKPLGAPSSGPDVPDNVLCLCANCHVLFDKHAFTIDENLRSTHLLTKIETHPKHPISSEYLEFHRGEFQKKQRIHTTS